MEAEIESYELPDLYCFDKRGKYRVFKIKVNCIQGVEKGYIISGTGLLYGKINEKTSIISSGKNIGKSNETTPVEQAKLIAYSKWKAKKKEGYKSIKDLQVRIKKLGKNYDITKSIDNIQIYLDYLYGIIGDKYNTTDQWNELPMLATPLNKVKSLPETVYIQPKLDGVRCLAKLKNNKVVLMSRGGTLYSLPHIEKQLLPLLQKYPKMILDGEIYKHNTHLQYISGAVRKEKISSLFDEREWLEYHIYDCAVSRVYQRDRLEVMQKRLLHYTTIENKNAINIKIVFTRSIRSIESKINEYHDKFIKQGYEGAILRDPFETYKFSFRDKCLVKVKKFQDEEFVIVGCKIDESKSIGESFVFELRNNKDNKTFYARPTGTEEMKENWYNNSDKWMGKYATVRFQERSSDNLPIQGHVRANKSEYLSITNLRESHE